MPLTNWQQIILHLYIESLFNSLPIQTASNEQQIRSKVRMICKHLHVNAQLSRLDSLDRTDRAREKQLNPFRAAR